MGNKDSLSNEGNQRMKISRRNFILVAISGVGAIALTLGKLLANKQDQPSLVQSPESGPNPTATTERYVGSEITPTSERATPESTLVVQEPIEGRPRVVHVWNQQATFWDFSTGWYGDHVDQNVVDRMVEEGLRALTGQDALLAAWDVLFQRVNESGYQSGEKIAIKVNLNNVRDCGENTNAINALHHPIMRRGLDVQFRIGFVPQLFVNTHIWPSLGEASAMMYDL